MPKSSHRHVTFFERATAHNRAFQKWPESHLRLGMEQGKPVLYGIWVLGNDYRNKSTYYGAYPPNFLSRLMAIFPEHARPQANGEIKVLHACSGSLPPSDAYVRLDVLAKLQPDVVGSVYDAGRLFGPVFELGIIDPPYSAADAQLYGTMPVNPLKATEALAECVVTGGHLAWLDTRWPMHNKKRWRTCGRIFIQRSTNHRVRLLTLFERQ